MSVKVFLKSSQVNKKEEAPLVFYCHYKGKQYVVSAGMTIPVKAWNHGKQKVNSTGLGRKIADRLNDKIKHKKDIIEGVLHHAELNGIAVNQPYLKAEYQKQLSPGEESGSEGYFYSCYNQYLEHCKTTLAKGTHEQHVLMYNYVASNYPDLTFQDIDYVFVQQLKTMLFEKGYSLHTSSSMLSRFKAFLNEQVKRGETMGVGWNKVTVKIKQGNVFFLDWEEVEELALFDAGKYQYVLDGYLFRCYTGIRFSDMKYVKKYNLSRDEYGWYLSFQTTKTSKKQQIAINQKAVDIIMKYGGALPEYTLRHENVIIKKICQQAGIKGEFEHIKYAAGERITTIKPRYEMVATHTARRSFARRWYEKGGNILKLSKHLGHSNIKTTLNYIGVKEEDIKNEMRSIFG